MIHDRLSDHQVAQAFGDTLSIIYKPKMKELNDDLSSVYSHLDKLDIPQVPAFHKWFAKQSLPHWAQEKFKAIEHIQKIRNIYKKMKNNPTDVQELNIDKAKQVPIETLYDFRRKGKNVSCPFHEDKSPSMSLKYNRYYCFSCHAKGSTVDFIMRLNPLMKFKDAVEYLNKL